LRIAHFSDHSPLIDYPPVAAHQRATDGAPDIET
jgi:hypothetical protein